MRLDLEHHPLAPPLPRQRMAGVEHLLVMEAPVGAFQDRVSEALIYGMFVAKLDEAIALESQHHFWK